MYTAWKDPGIINPKTFKNEGQSEFLRPEYAGEVENAFY
jgi:hypothetical protein